MNFLDFHLEALGRSFKKVTNQKIAVLLATYNGEKYLTEQIKSILEQCECNFHLYIRDDGSTDGTKLLLTQFANQFPTKITYLPMEQQGGVIKNFSELMNIAVNYPYVMLCDQDDVWFPEKISQTLQKMQALENSWGKEIPLLVHTDLKVVDADLNPIAASFWRYCHLTPQSQSLNRLIVQNVVTGCTVMLNRALLHLCLPIPKEAIMHDWWIALTAAAFGKIGIVDAPTLYYRQHTNNTLGAQNFQALNYFKRGILKLLQGNYIGETGNYRQINFFFNRYQNRLTHQQYELISAYLSQPKNRWTKRRYIMLKYQFFKCGILRNFIHFLFGLKYSNECNK